MALDTSCKRLGWPCVCQRCGEEIPRSNEGARLNQEYGRAETAEAKLHAEREVRRRLREELEKIHARLLRERKDPNDRFHYGKLTIAGLAVTTLDELERELLGEGQNERGE